MTLRESIRDFESIETSARANAASDLDTFLGIIESLESFNNLVKLAADRADRYVATRAIRLMKEPGNPEYAHPYDAALAGYILILHYVSSPWLRSVLEAARQTSNTWWTWQLADQLRAGMKEAPEWEVISLVGSLGSAAYHTDDKEAIGLAATMSLANVDVGIVSVGTAGHVVPIRIEQREPTWQPKTYSFDSDSESLISDMGEHQGSLFQREPPVRTRTNDVIDVGA